MICIKSLYFFDSLFLSCDRFISMRPHKREDETNLVTLVKDSNFERQFLLEELLVVDRARGDVVRGDDDIELLHRLELVAQLRPVRLRSVVARDDESGREDGELSHPVLERRGGDDDEMGTLLAVGLEVRHESDDLGSLSETCGVESRQRGIQDNELEDEDSPISSARIQDVFLEYKRFSQLTPSIW